MTLVGVPSAQHAQGKTGVGCQVSGEKFRGSGLGAGDGRKEAGRHGQNPSADGLTVATRWSKTVGFAIAM